MVAMPRLADIRERLTDNPADITPRSDNEPQAAVAVLLRERNDTTEVLFIKRAEQDGDPWSGHMAFPGGRVELHDADLLHTAIRETEEEIGFNPLDHGEFIAALEPMRAQPRGQRQGLVVAPFVFHIDGDPPLIPNYEVADVVWTPVVPLLSGDTLTTYPWTGLDGQSTFPGYEVEKGYIVWGLTYRMLHTFFEIVHPEWTPPPES